MGSLMSGWDSNVPDPKKVKFTRNKSQTNDEIGAFWISKKHKDEEHLRDLSLLSPRTKKMIFEEAVERCEGPIPNAEPLSKDLLEMESETNVEEIIQKHGWWASSNMAFLNEPPVIQQEGAGQRYASQFHVADAAGSTGIGA